MSGTLRSQTSPSSPRLGLRTRVAAAVGTAAARASRAAGRGSGGMIGGIIAHRVDPTIMEGLAAGRRSIIVTGTNGKSTTNRMTAAALRTVSESVASNVGGDNMDAGVIAALLADRSAQFAALEVDELHVHQVADKVRPEAIILLNLTRDQLDRVGEINAIERRLRAAVNAHPEATIVANCDDVLVTSAAFDAPNVVWVAAGGAWGGDSVSCPRTGEPIVRDTHGLGWRSTGTLEDGREFSRPEPQWWVDDEGLHGPGGFFTPLSLSLPGRANRGNAAQAVAAAVALEASPEEAARATETVTDVAGRYRTIDVDGRQTHLLLAKNPAGWQEALSMVDTTAEGLVIAVNGQIPDGEDLSWLWDVRFESFEELQVVAAGERGTDLGVRLTYADVTHTLVHDPIEAIRSCPPGRVEVLANYTAFRDLHRNLDRLAAGEELGVVRAAGSTPPANDDAAPAEPGASGEVSSPAGARSVRQRMTRSATSIVSRVADRLFAVASSVAEKMSDETSKGARR